MMPRRSTTTSNTSCARQNVTLIFIGFGILLAVSVVEGFVSSAICRQKEGTPSPWMSLNASKKPSKKSAKSSSTNSNGRGGGFGGGFGSAKNTASASSSSTAAKTRSLSSHAPGAGTKPLRTAANTFDQLRQEHGPECTHDVYCRSPLNDKDTFWFVGKVAVRPGTAATATQACLSQKRLILEYSKSELRPQNLAGRYASTLELWLAPGDSEMDAVQNKVRLERVEGSAADLAEDFNVKDVGFNPEIYVVRSK